MCLFLLFFNGHMRHPFNHFPWVSRFSYGCFMSSIDPFHLAIPVFNLETCRTFSRDTIGCDEGRHSDHWVGLISSRNAFIAVFSTVYDQTQNKKANRSIRNMV